MASIQCRISRGKKYWSIVESRRVDGKPRTFILEYLGTAETLLKRLNNEEGFSLKSYSHGDTAALLNIAKELNIVNIINKHIPLTKNKTKPKRDGLTVGASILLASIGRACQPTSKMAWYDWCKTTSLEYSLKKSFKELTSQHFWDQMNALPINAISEIEEEIVRKVLDIYKVKPGCLFFDTTNFFTFIDSNNERCGLPQRGRNKQKRMDLRQVGLALLVSKDDQFPLFHRTYRGDKNDITVFKENFHDISKRMMQIDKELLDITVVFDKGNNSKDNFKMLDEQNCYYVAGLVSSYFKSIVEEANKNFEDMEIEGEIQPIFKTKREIWGKERTCIVTISTQLKEGQIRGIEQHLEKKHTQLNELKQQLESDKKRKHFPEEAIKQKLTSIIHGQFIDEILKFEIIKLANGDFSFTYYIDFCSFNYLKENILGRKIVVTNRHDWSPEEILLAYRGQAKVEYAFRTIKNPNHLAVRPQYHWTDQKIEVHFFICIVGYLLAVAAYMKAKKAGYQKNIHNLMEELNQIRVGYVTKKKSSKIRFQLEVLPPHLKNVLKILNISEDAVKQNINLSDYIE